MNKIITQQKNMFPVCWYIRMLIKSHMKKKTGISKISVLAHRKHVFLLVDQKFSLLKIVSLSFTYEKYNFSKIISTMYTITMNKRENCSNKCIKFNSFRPHIMTHTCTTGRERKRESKRGREGGREKEYVDQLLHRIWWCLVAGDKPREAYSVIQFIVSSQASYQFCLVQR